MHLYTSSSEQFISDVVQNRIADSMRNAFFNYFRFSPSPNEVKSWQNSLRAVCNVLQYGSFEDNGIIVEYQLPLTSKRLDCMVTGTDSKSSPNAVIIELKQWEEVRPSYVDDCVTVFMGQGWRDRLHPSRQVGDYQEYLEDYHVEFTSGAIGLSSCAYLHNFSFDAGNELFSPRHAKILERFPLFSGDRANDLADYLRKWVGNGQGTPVLEKVLGSKYLASKKLLEHTAAVIARQQVYVLLDEQHVVFNSVLAEARRSREDFGKAGKTVMIVKGGPGTGKSVIALKLVGELSGSGYNTQHATGSRAFTGNIQKVVGPRAGKQFRYFNGYVEAQTNEIDVLICDEAHRIRPNSWSRYRPAKKSEKTQVEELIDAAKVSVFLLDDLQVVRPGEVGSCDLIRSAAVARNARVVEFELEAQFRCNGSDGFINWIDNTLGIRRTANVLWDLNDPFEFRIFNSVGDLDQQIRARHLEGYSSRLVAGFCWPWSDPVEGSLVDDVVIGNWSMPWNAKPDSTRLGPGIPKSQYWSSDPNGIGQVGCVYTAQGFEFDYCGVIFGRDLRYDPMTGEWVGDKKVSEDTVVKRSDPEKFLDLVKNTYRVLLTRGMKGCYVYFMDEETRKFVQSRLEKLETSGRLR